MIFRDIPPTVDGLYWVRAKEWADEYAPYSVMPAWINDAAAEDSCDCRIEILGSDVSCWREDFLWGDKIEVPTCESEK